MNARKFVKLFIPKKLFKRIEPTGHLLEAIIENIVFGFPARRLKVIGVTGTAGKTTTCTLITHLLQASGYKVAMMTTVSIDYGDGRGPVPNDTRMTSLGSLPLLKAIKKMRANGAEWLVLETTSQALSQHRVFGIPYWLAVFTNLSDDNYHYHGTFERYRTAKVKLFKQCNRNRRGFRTGLVNADDENGRYFAEAIKRPISYGLKKGDWRAKKVRLTANGSQFEAEFDGEVYSISCNLPGKFNVYNCLAAVGVGRALGLTRPQIEQGIASLPAVEGRMNSIDAGQDFGVIVDYACTPESFNQVFAATKPLVQGRTIVVFGSAGRRDEAKRAVQGEIAARSADIVILAEEDDRDQDGQQILEEIAAGAEAAGKLRGQDLLLIHWREDAVKKAIALAKTGDLVLLLGKGEERQIITNKPGFKPRPGHNFSEATDTIRRPYNEAAAAREALSELKTKK